MSEKRYGATEEEWDFFTLIGLEEDMLPAVGNPLAKISDQSSLKELGKTPSLYNRKRQVVGIGRTGRKVIWVEPYWRGPEEAPILTRPYHVGPTE